MALSTNSLGASVIGLVTFRNILIAVFGLLVYKALGQIIYYRFFHPLAKFPGPFWASVTRLWIAYHNVKEDEVYLELDLHKKHGMSLMRLCPAE